MHHWATQQSMSKTHPLKEKNCSSNFSLGIYLFASSCFSLSSGVILSPCRSPRTRFSILCFLTWYFLPISNLLQAVPFHHVVPWVVPFFSAEWPRVRGHLPGSPNMIWFQPPQLFSKQLHLIQTHWYNLRRLHILKQVDRTTNHVHTGRKLPEIKQ